MPRQNQDQGSYVSGITGVVPVEKGGTGGRTPEEASANLGGVSRSKIDQPNGIAMTNELGLLKPEYFNQALTYFGPRIKGPKELVRECMARFYITNYSSQLTVNVEVEGYTHQSIGFVSQGPHFAFKVPYDVSEMTVLVTHDGLTDRITLPAVAPRLEAPQCLSPSWVTYGAVAWLEFTLPQFNGTSWFDDYAPAAPGTFRGVGRSTTAINTTYDDYFPVMGRAILTPDYPFTEIRLAGKLSNSNSFMHATVEGVTYSFDTVHDEFVIKPLHNCEVIVDAGVGEVLWVSYTRPVHGNRSDPSTDDLDVWIEIEASPSQTGPWYSFYNNKINYRSGSIRVPLKNVPPGERFYRARYVYKTSVILTSDWSEAIPFRVSADTVAQAVNVISPNVTRGQHFGRGLSTVYLNNTQEFFTSEKLNNGENVVYHYRIVNDVYHYVGLVKLPYESTRLPGEDFGYTTAVSDDGQYLFVGAPKAEFTDIPNTKGAVYVYERTGGGYNFIQRLTDENQQYVNFGQGVTESNDLLVVLVGGTETQLPSLYTYVKNNLNGKFKMMQNVHRGVPGKINWTSISAARHGFPWLETYLSSKGVLVKDLVLLSISGVEYLTEGSQTSASLEIWAFSAVTGVPMTGQLFITHTGNAFATPFYETALGYRVIMTEEGYDEENQKYSGSIYIMDPTNGVLHSLGWFSNKDAGALTLSAGDSPWKSFPVPNLGGRCGDIAVLAGGRGVLLGAFQSTLSINGVACPEGGIIYQLTPLYNNGPTGVAPA